MIPPNTTTVQRRQELHNAIGNIINSLHTIQTKESSWDSKILIMQNIAKLVPLIIRYMIYFKNVT